MRTIFLSCPLVGNVTDPASIANDLLGRIGITADDVKNIEEGKVKVEDFVNAFSGKMDENARKRVAGDVEKLAGSQIRIGVYKKVEESLAETLRQVELDPDATWKDVQENERVTSALKCIVTQYAAKKAAFEADLSKMDKGEEVTRLKAELGQVQGLLGSANKRNEEQKGLIEKGKTEADVRERAAFDKAEKRVLRTTTYSTFKDRLSVQDEKLFWMNLESQMGSRGHKIEFERDALGDTIAVRPLTVEGAGIQIDGKTDNHSWQTYVEMVSDALIKKSNAPEPTGFPRLGGFQIPTGTTLSEIAKSAGVSEAFLTA